MLKTGLAGLAAGIISLLGAAAEAQTLKPFKFGISAPIVTIFPAYVADAHKLFEKHGLKADIVNMEGGSRGIQVLLSGEIQAMSVGVAPVVQATTSRSPRSAARRSATPRFSPVASTPRR